MRKSLSVFLILFLIIGSISAQTKKVSGVVLSAEDNEPVIGASVVAKGKAAVGTITDIDGKFELNAGDDVKILVISYVGMKQQEIEAKPGMKIVLQSNAKELDEVVVTAMVISREKKA